MLPLLAARRAVFQLRARSAIQLSRPLRTIRDWPARKPTILLAVHECRERFWIPFQTYAADGATRPKLRGRSVSSAVPCISFRKLLGTFIRCTVAPSIGRKAAQERFSEEVSGQLIHPETRYSKAQR